MTAVVAALFPAFVRCCVEPVTSECDTPFDDELEIVAHAAPPRQRGFTCGRACAHAALRDLGVDDAPIRAGADREPLWPPGVAGSISHTDALAAAVVARDADAWGLGLDLEAVPALMDERVRRLVLTPMEREQARALEPLHPHAAALMFSAKECVYKALFPAMRRRLGHQDVAVTLDINARRFIASISVGGVPPTFGGAFAEVEGHVVTAVCITPAMSPRPGGAQ